jgi:hypothetical protein
VSTYKTIETKLFHLWLTALLTASMIILSTSFLRFIVAIIVCNLILFSSSILMFVKLFDIFSFKLDLKVMAIGIAISMAVMAAADMIIIRWG